VGAELLRGTLLDDSLSAQVQLCLVSKECTKDDGTGLAVLIVGKQLAGGVHSKKPCAASARSLVLRRPSASQALRAPRPVDRLSRTGPPKSPRQVPSMEARKPRAAPPAPAVAMGEVAGRPVGEDQAPRYDARRARKKRRGSA